MRKNKGIIIMKMKYFRFLYGEAGQCFMHFGEVKDTLTGENFTFLYLRGTDGHVDQEKSGHTLFLCPKRLNLVVLGNSDAAAVAAMETILKEATVDTLVVSAAVDIADIRGMSPDTEIIRLGPSEGGCCNGMTSSDAQAAFEKERIDEEGSAYTNCYRIIGAGWNFTVKAYLEDSVTMIHNLNRNETEKNPFEDCVMSVKMLDSGKRCKREPAPDSFGCALGCTLHQDYDVCKYQSGNTVGSYVTGTIILSGAETVKVKEALEKDMKARLGEVRFIVLPDGKGCNQQEEGSLQIMASECKRYFIGSEAGLNDRAIADICRSGLYYVPVVLKEGRGICCSGLLKYAENDK